MISKSISVPGAIPFMKVPVDFHCCKDTYIQRILGQPRLVLGRLDGPSSDPVVLLNFIVDIYLLGKGKKYYSNIFFSCMHASTL